MKVNKITSHQDKTKLSSTVSGLRSVAYYISVGALCWGCCCISITGLFLSSPAGCGGVVVMRSARWTSNKTI